MRARASDRAAATRIQMKTSRTSTRTDITQPTKSKLPVKYSILYSEIIDHKYLLLKKLGWGHFSTVWLAIKL